MAIHPTAQVDPGARLADGVDIGPWTVIGPNVTLAEGVRVAGHVVIQQDTTVGAGTTIHPFCVMGGDPQHGGYKGEPVGLEIGENNTIREHSTFNRGTPGDRKLTTIGSNGFFMTGAGRHSFAIFYESFSGVKWTVMPSVFLSRCATCSSRALSGRPARSKCSPTSARCAELPASIITQRSCCWTYTSLTQWWSRMQCRAFQPSAWQHWV